MKKIMFLFLTVLTLVMFSCETQERIKNVTINPPQMMSMFKVTPAGSQITSTDTVSISVPNVADVTASTTASPRGEQADVPFYMDKNNLIVAIISVGVALLINIVYHHWK